MESMNFPQYIQLLHEIIEPESDTVKFTRTVFEAAIPAKHIDLLGAPNYNKGIIVSYGNNNTIKAYYNGKTKISRLSKRIVKYFDQKTFTGYIKHCTTPTDREKLLSAFEQFLPADTKVSNIPNAMAELLYSIIQDAAQTQKNEDLRPKPKSSSILQVLDADFEHMSEEEQYRAVYESCKDTLHSVAMLDILDLDTPISLGEDMQIVVAMWKTKIMDFRDHDLRLCVERMIQYLRGYIPYFSVPRLPFLRGKQEEYRNDELSIKDTELFSQIDDQTYYLRHRIREPLIRLFEIGIHRGWIATSAIPDDCLQYYQQVLAERNS